MLQWCVRDSGWCARTGESTMKELPSSEMWKDVSRGDGLQLLGPACFQGRHGGVSCLAGRPMRQVCGDALPAMRDN